MTGIGNDSLMNGAQRSLEMGNLDHAIELLCQLLGRDPQSAPAHALLAMALVQQDRLPAARQEAGIALSLAPGEAYCLYAASVVAMLQLRFREAHALLDEALAIDPESADYLAARGRILLLEERWRPAAEAFEAALAVEGDNVDALVGLAEAYWRAGFGDHAEPVLREALRLAPGHPGALTQMGWLLLERGDSEPAREHALWVLAEDATDQGALALLTAVKARESWFLSLWWRLNAWMMHKGDVARIAILVGLYVVVQIARTVMQQNGMEEASGSLSLVWLAFCIYTWVGPAMFEKQLNKELEKVRLQTDF